MHAFGKNTVLIWILSTLLVVTAVGSVALIIWRWREFDSHDEVESGLSRDFLYYVTNLLLTLFAVAVAFATVAVPLIMEPDGGASTYDVVARPLGVVILAMIAVCPLLAWRKTEGAQFRKTLILPTVTMLVSVPLWLYLGPVQRLGLHRRLVCGFAFGAVIQFVCVPPRRAAGPDGASGPASGAPSPAAARAPPPTSCIWAWSSSSLACSVPPCTRSSSRPSSRSSRVRPPA